MIDKRIVRRYAAALFASAQSQGIIDAVESDLGLISYTCESVPKLKEAIISPLIPTEKKRDVVKDVFADKIHEITLFYLYLLIDNRREEIIVETEAEFVSLANEVRGIVVAKVTSAVELTEDEGTQLQMRLSKRTGRQVTLSTEVDPSIIGGLIVRIGDTIMDGSIVGHLRRMKDEFLDRQ